MEIALQSTLATTWLSSRLFPIADQVKKDRCFAAVKS
jgi:hypothetical protein